MASRYSDDVKIDAKNKTKRIQMADIAKMSGVSVSTVSRALAGSPQVSVDTREYIAELARRNGYVVNPLARSLRLQRTEVINVVFPLGHAAHQLITDPFLLELLGRLADEIVARGYELLVSKVAPPEAGWLDRLINAQRADGVIIIGQSDQEAALARAGGNHLPMVVWGAWRPDQTYCVVGTDNVEGGRLAARRLISQGRRKLAFLGDVALPEIRDRNAGFWEVCREAGIELDCRRVIYSSVTRESARAAATTLCQSGLEFDGVFAASDVIALEGLAAMKSKGLRAPDDVAVIGFDDSMVAAHAEPALTTIHQALDQGAKHLVDLLFRRMQGEDAPGLAMAPELVVRASG